MESCELTHKAFCGSNALALLWPGSSACRVSLRCACLCLCDARHQPRDTNLMRLCDYLRFQALHLEAQPRILGLELHNALQCLF